MIKSEEQKEENRRKASGPKGPVSSTDKTEHLRVLREERGGDLAIDGRHEYTHPRSSTN